MNDGSNDVNREYTGLKSTLVWSAFLKSLA